MNWKLKNNYFLFGLKRGIKEPIARNKMAEYLFGSEQVKTKLDWQAVDDTFSRINSRFRTAELRQTEGHNKKQIVLGLPYDMRIAQNTKKAIELIHSIEKGQFEAKPMDASSLEDDNGKELSQSGKIWQIYQGARNVGRVEPQETDNMLAEELRQEAMREAADMAEETEADGYDLNRETPFKNNKLTQ